MIKKHYIPKYFTQFKKKLIFFYLIQSFEPTKLTILKPFCPGRGGAVTGLKLEYLQDDSLDISSSPTFGQHRYQLLLLLTPGVVSNWVNGTRPTISNSASNGSFSLGSGIGKVPAVE